MILKLTHRVQAFLALLITTAFVVMGMSLMPSLADETGGELGGSTQTANIDPNSETAPRSLTIHKYANPENPTNLQHNGTKLDDDALAGLVGLEGVEFKVWKIEGLDLTSNTNADWNSVSKLTANPDCSGAKIGTLPATVNMDTPFYTGKTGSDGSLSVPNVEIAAYLVCETDHGNNDIVKAVAPFIVVVPMPKYDAQTGAVTNEWNYDVHVYPKNSVTNITKKVDDSNAFKVGDIVNWTIQVDIPNLPAGDSIETFKVTDQLDPRLKYVDSQVEINAAQLEPKDPHNDYSVVVEGNVVTFTLGENGLALANSDQGEKLTITIKTEAISATTDDPEYSDGLIVNKAWPNINGVDISPAKDTTKWGRLNLLKHVEGNEADVLAQAEFTVQPKTSAGTECIADDFATTNTPVINVITNNKGVAVYKDGTYAGQPVDLKVGDYCVRETKAPAGYVLPDINDSNNWRKVTINAGTTTTANAQINVPNEKPTFPQLPITGSATQLALTLGGIAVLLTAIGVGVHNTRLRRADN